MKHERIPSAPRARRSSGRASTQPSDQAREETPAQKAAFDRRVNRAARRAEAKMAAAEAARAAAEAALPAVAEHHEPLPIDAHGFDPADYRWLPVKRKPRKDGWTPQRQQAFIAALAQSGSLEFACMQVDMSKSSAHRLRRSPGGEQFSAAWDVALQHAARVLLDTAFERAFNGSTEPVFDRAGNPVGMRYRQNDRLLMFLLRAYMPERFRHAHRDSRGPNEAVPPAPAPMDEVLRRLIPVTPDEPHKLLPPDELAEQLEVADIMDGKLPPYLRGRGDAENPLMPSPEFEAALERAKRGEPDGYGIIPAYAPMPRGGDDYDAEFG